MLLGVLRHFIWVVFYRPKNARTNVCVCGLCFNIGKIVEKKEEVCYTENKFTRLVVRIMNIRFIVIGEIVICINNIVKLVF